MTQEGLTDIIACDENYRIERTFSTGDMDKFQEAICAFADDLSAFCVYIKKLIINMSCNKSSARQQQLSTKMPNLPGNEIIN